MVAYRTGLNPIEIGHLWSKAKVTVTQYPFLDNSLLTFQLWISALLCLIKMKFSMPPRYAYGRFVFEFLKNQMGDDVIVTSSNIFQTIVHISNSTEPTNFIFGTEIQQH